MATSELDTEIETAATTPAEGSADGVRVQQRSIDDMIKADKYLAAKRARSNPLGGMKMQKIKPPGSTGAT